MKFNYIITLTCENEKDAKNYDRELYMNDYDSAKSIFESLVKFALQSLINPYVITLSNSERIIYKLEKI